MSERFVATLVSNRTNSYMYSESEIGVITGILKKKRFDPEQCLLRGYTGIDSVKRAITKGDDSQHPTNRTFLMEMRKQGNEYEFVENDLVTSPLNYTGLTDNQVSGLSVYDKTKMEAGEYDLSWHFKEGVSAKDALLGVIVILDSQKLRRDRRQFNQFIAKARRIINK
ncbi:MAG TPA: hypothetical protein VF189_01925 [Patescibacteria group bacterium]